MAHIKERSNPDFVLHLAAHYDFKNVELPDYAAMSYSELRWSIGVVYDLLTAAVRTGDRGLLLTYIHNLAKQRFASGFPPAEVCDALLAISNVTVEKLLYKPINNGTEHNETGSGPCQLTDRRLPSPNSIMIATACPGCGAAAVSGRSTCAGQWLP